MRFFFKKYGSTRFGMCYFVVIKSHCMSHVIEKEESSNKNLLFLKNYGEMANVALSEAEKTFILHGVEVCSIFIPNMTTNQQYFCTLSGRFSVRWSFPPRLSPNGVGM